MQTSVLVLVRHGQSEWNHENRFTGWIDVGLTREGEQEARRAGMLLRGTRFDHAFTSALRRAQETLRIILEVSGQTGVPVTEDKALNERHYGDLQGRDKAEVIAQYGAEQVKVWRRSYRVAPPGGESLLDTANRVLPFYEANVVPLLRAGKNVLLVAHGSTVRALAMQLEGISEADIVGLEIPTGVPRRYVMNTTGEVVTWGELGV